MTFMTNRRRPGNTVFPVLAMALLLMSAAASPSTASATTDSAAGLYVVSFTAAWCPNCRILDPKVHSALGNFGGDQVTHVVLDMTDGDTRLASFGKVDGTVLAGVYGDHLGVTGIAMLTASDSGEKLGCATRLHSTAEITAMINAAKQQMRDHPALSRPGNLGACPRANKKQAL